MDNSMKIKSAGSFNGVEPSRHDCPLTPANPSPSPLTPSSSL